MPYTAVIIEDQRMFRDLLEALINSAPDFNVVGTANSAANGWDICQEKRPNLVLCDLGLPDSSGLELAKRIKKSLPGVTLLAVTSLIDPVTTTHVYDSGFHGYVEKDQSPETLLEAVQTVAEGGHYFTQLVRENRKKIFNDRDALNKILSPREQSIIGWVCLKTTSRDIAAKLEVSTRTIENHRYRIIKRLGLQNTQDLIDFGHRLGLHRIVEIEEKPA